MHIIRMCTGPNVKRVKNADASVVRILLPPLYLDRIINKSSLTIISVDNFHFYGGQIDFTNAWSSIMYV